MIVSVDPAEASVPQLGAEDLLKLFVEIYSLPRYSDHIKDTSPNTQERTAKLLELQTKLSQLYSNFNKRYDPDNESLTTNKYSKHIDALKSDLIENFIKVYPDMPTFMIINEINTKLNSGHLLLCDQLNQDMTLKMKDMRIEKEVKDYLKGMFQKYDADGSGTISLKELEDHFKKLGLSPIMAHQLMETADTGKDGEISAAEFEAYTESQIMKYYKVFFNLDSNNDYRLNYRQARQSLHEVYPNIDLTDDLYKNVFKTMDQDKTGLITFEEWCDFLILFPQKNIEFLETEWKLFALTTVDPQEPASAFMEKDITHKKGKISLSYFDLLKIFFCGGVSGGISRTVTAPLERLKVLYQTMYTTSKPPNILRGLMDTYEQKGLLSLFKGNSISIIMSVLEQAMRFCIIEYSKKHYEDEFGNIKSNHYFLIIGVVTSVLSTLVLFPLDVVRIRFISSGEKYVTKKIVKIYNNFGIKGFYSGLIPHMMSVLPAGSFNVFFYNMLKKVFITKNDIENPKMTKFMLIGGTAAYITGTVTYPFTLLTSRMIVANRDVKVKSQRVGLFRIVKNTLLNEGPSGFFKGYSASMLRIFIGQSINFGIYESLRNRIVKPKDHSKK